jgi:hypothetical protein
MVVVVVTAVVGDVVNAGKVVDACISADVTDVTVGVLDRQPTKGSTRSR